MISWRSLEAGGLNAATSTWKRHDAEEVYMHECVAVNRKAMSYDGNWRICFV